MSLQARFSANDNRLYRPERDVAHNFGSIAMVVAQRLEELENTPGVLSDFKKHFQITDDELGEACAAFCKFVVSASDPKSKSMAQSLEESGWFAVKEPAQFLYVALLGTVISGVYWSGVREASIANYNPCENYKELAEHGVRISRIMTMPKWKRGFARLWARVTSACNALFSRSKE